MTHSELIETGARFLKHQGYWMWLAEPSTTCVEKPDLIAWKLDHSILLECKVSRADFLKDGKKSFRKDGTGMGNFRIYVAPKGLIKTNELPDGWGLLEVIDENTVMFSKRPTRIEGINIEAERLLMYSWAFRKEKNCLRTVRPTGKKFRLLIPDNVGYVSSDGKCYYVSGELTFVKTDNKSPVRQSPSDN